MIMNRKDMKSHERKSLKILTFSWLSLLIPSSHWFFMLDCLPVILTPTILMKKVITIRYRANPCLTICPCMFMMTTVLVLLHTTIWSMFLGITWTELMWTSPPEVPPKDLKVFWHSVVLVFQTLTVPSDDALLKETNIYHKLINDSQ